ncbi:MAG: hypothetical protein WCQ89_16035 [Verrucomicrobiota bacterium]
MAIHEVHPPGGSVHTWKDFLVHIVTITVGLLIAVGIEQTVEYFHHRHQRHLLEEQMYGVFESDLREDANSLRKLGARREYLVELRAAISARLVGNTAVSAPSSSDPRMAQYLIFASLAPYEAAKQNGSVAWLSVERMRIYNRISFARDLQAMVRDHWFESLAALESFNEKFVDSRGALALGGSTVAPDLGVMSPVDLGAYLGLVATAIKRGDTLAARIDLFDFEVRAVLDGVSDEDELVARMLQKYGTVDPPGHVPAGH